jgi:hypothetical protein
LKLLSKTRAVVRVRDLVEELPDLNVARTVRRLARAALVELEGVDLAAATPSREDPSAALGAVVPVRAGAPLGAPVGAPLNPTLEQVLALVDGRRSAELIGRELRLTPSRVRDSLRALRAAGRIAY